MLLSSVTYTVNSRIWFGSCQHAKKYQLFGWFSQIERHYVFGRRTVKIPLGMTDLITPGEVAIRIAKQE